MWKSFQCHLSQSSDLLLWVGVLVGRRDGRPSWLPLYGWNIANRHKTIFIQSTIVSYLLTSSSQELLGQTLPNLVCTIFRVRRQEIVNFMNPTPRGIHFGVKKCKIDVFLKNLLYSWASFRQTKCIVIMTKERSTKIINFMTSGRVLVLEHGHHIVKMH